MKMAAELFAASTVDRPGTHSFNRQRVALRERAGARLIYLRLLLLSIGILCLGYYAYSAASEYIYQTYENWVFDRNIARPAPARSAASPARPREGEMIGRVAINRLGLTAVVREGVSNSTLNIAAGHIPSTALPGEEGNFAIAAHRDTLFRSLQSIRVGDRVSFETNSGKFNYQVAATRVVKPSDVAVLRPDGGGLVAQPGPLLTLITCYPFRYIGAAPQRFIVECKFTAQSEAANK